MKDEIDKIVDRLVKLPPAKWDAAHQKLTRVEQADVAGRLRCIAEDAARRAAYFDAMEYEPGLHGKHEDAVRYQNKVATKVRAALGYSYPKRNIYF